MSHAEWIESAGGPLVVVPRSQKNNWKGVESDDYDEACRVDDYVGSLDRGWGEVLVLGDEPFRTTIIERPDGVAVVRWMYSPSDEQILDVAMKVNLSNLKPFEELEVAVRPEPYVVFDSGADGSSADVLEFTPPSSTKVVQTYVVKDDEAEVGMVLHLFRR